tara:strand:- start:67 stop:1191 length:1125 start_codon:yes stop_codon:yes gene_type:complete
MNSSIIYHSADPEALQTYYREYNNVDFVINVGEGRSLVRNSVRIVGDVKVDGTAGVRATGGVYFDNKIGIHAVIDSCQTTFNGIGGGVKENIQNYARWVAQSAIASLNEDDYLNASQQVELRTTTAQGSENNALGNITAETGGTPVTSDIDFAFKPTCILNKMVGDHLPFEKSGEIRLTLNLARSIAALEGRSQVVASYYLLSNLRCSYQSVSTEGNWSDTSTSMRSVYNVKSSIQSGSANISAQVPAICDSVSCSFQRQDTENVIRESNYSCQKVPGITDLQFLFNDSTSKYITYQMKDENEMLKRYIDSFTNTGHNQVMLDTFRTNQGFGVGVDFTGFTDLSNQRFGVQLSSSILPTSPYNIYMYFHSLVQV